MRRLWRIRCARQARPPFRLDRRRPLPPRCPLQAQPRRAAKERDMVIAEAPERTGHDRKAADAVIAALAARFGNRLVTSQAVREQHANTLTWIDNQPPDAVVFPHIDRRSAGDRAAVRRAARAGHRVRHRHLARGPGQRAARRHLPRFPRHEPRACRPCRGSRLRHRAWHHPQAAQRAPARPRPVLPDRSRRRCFARRHGLDARVRHQCGALRHHEGQRAGAQSGAGQRRSDVDRRGGRRNPPPATI